MDSGARSRMWITVCATDVTEDRGRGRELLRPLVGRAPIYVSLVFQCSISIVGAHVDGLTRSIHADTGRY